MDHKTAVLLTSLIGMAAIAYSVAAENPEISPQTRQAVPQRLASFPGMAAAQYSVMEEIPGTIPQARWAVPQQTERSDAAPRFSDLYSITWEEMPMPYSTPYDYNYILADSINNEGMIAGKQGDTLVFWHPDTKTWELVPGSPFDGGQQVFISPDGSSIIASNVRETPGTDYFLTWYAQTWSRSAGWQALPGSVVNQSKVVSISRNFRFAAGTGNDNGRAGQAWVWALDGGVQQMLPSPDWSLFANARAVSDDGNVVVGFGIRAPLPDEEFSDYLALRWIGGGPPTQLLAPDGNEIGAAVACNADCSTVFGSNGWFLKDDGEFGFLFWALGNPPDADTRLIYGTYTIGDASSDGSMVVGLYWAKLYPSIPDSEATVQRIFIWKEETGVTSLTDAMGVGGDNPDYLDWDLFSTLRFSPDGRHILISGSRDSVQLQSRVVVLHVTPKAFQPVGHSRHATRPPGAAPNAALRPASRVSAD